MIYITYEKTTGRILCRSTIPNELYETCRGDNTLELDADPLTQYIDLNTLKPVTMPPKPGDAYEFDYASKQWVVNLEVARILAVIERNRLLVRSDWTQLPDVPLATKTAWAEYRQALREVPEQPGFPTEITWPTPP